MEKQFELDRFRADGSQQIVRVAPKPRIRQLGWFVKGPLPGGWIGNAAHLPGKALHVGLAVWFLSGREKRPVVKLTSDTLRKFGVNRYASRRALLWLEEVGLVRVNRKRGRCPLVEILTPVASSDA